MKNLVFDVETQKLFETDVTDEQIKQAEIDKENDDKRKAEKALQEEQKTTPKSIKELYDMLVEKGVL